MDASSAAIAVLALAWVLAAAATWRSGSARSAGWFVLTACVHAVAARWHPGAPLAMAAWLTCGLALPSGRLHSSVRRAITVAGIAGAAVWTIALAGSSSGSRIAGPGLSAAAAVAVAAIVGSAAAMRCRDASRSDRWMMQWLAATGVLTVAVATVLVALHYLVDVPDSIAPWLIAALVLIPLGQACVAFSWARAAADVVFVESMVVAGLAMFVVAVYLVVVIGLGHVPVGGERKVLVSSLVAAVVIAVLALPVRQRALAVADIFVQSRGSSAEHVLSTVSARMTRAVPMDELLLQMTESLHATIATAGAEIWVGQDGILTRTVSVPRRTTTRLDLGGQARIVVARARLGGQSWAAMWLPTVVDESAERTKTPGSNGGRPDLRVAPISHMGELLGLVVVRRHAGDSAFTEEDERLLVELARQLGLALHNVRLDSALQASLEELQRRNEELQASRLRIVGAADESRRAIERNLHDGAQQYLVALAVKLNIAGQLAEEDPALLTGMLEELRGDVQATIRELRELAHGIYPPLLRDRGLGEALRTAANRSPLPCTLDVELPGRYPQDVETAVYFCCLEALQNAGKHAGAGASVVVRVRGEGGAISFAVEDDGAGFGDGHQAGNGFLNMQDRLGAMGGTLTVTSNSGAGTTISGSIPAGPLAVPPQPADVRATV